MKNKHFCHVGSAEDNKTLEEQNCYNGQIGISALYGCSNGCKDGACMSNETTST